MPYNVQVTVRGTAPLSFSRYVPPKERDEESTAYEERVFRDRCPVDQKKHVVVDAIRFKKALIAAARLLGEKVAGRGNKRYYELFLTGVLPGKGFALKETRATIEGEWLYLHAQPVKGEAAGRIPKKYPLVKSWQGTFTLTVVHPEITHDVFKRHMTFAGQCAGIGRWRAEVGGCYGTFEVTKIEFKPL